MASSSELPAPVQKEIDDLITEIEHVKTEEEFEQKVAASSRFGFSITSWMKVLFNKPVVEEFHAEWLTIDEYKRQAEESMQSAFQVINLPNWRVEKRGSTKGDIVESRQTDAFGKVYRFTGIVDCPAQFLYEEFRDNITKLPDWNPTILRSDLIKEIGPGIDLSYQVTAGGGRGIIAPRDFVILRRCAALARDGRVAADSDAYCYISSGVSVAVPGYPPGRDVVRGVNKVGCWCLKPIKVKAPGKELQQTQFQWLMCCDLKGKIPQFVLDAAFATVMLDYIVHVRKFAAEAKAKGLF